MMIFIRVFNLLTIRIEYPLFVYDSMISIQLVVGKRILVKIPNRWLLVRIPDVCLPSGACCLMVVIAVSPLSSLIIVLLLFLADGYCRYVLFPNDFGVVDGLALTTQPVVIWLVVLNMCLFVFPNVLTNGWLIDLHIFFRTIVFNQPTWINMVD